jgi:hypothetical protein
LSDKTKELLSVSGFEFRNPSGVEDKDADLPHRLIRPVQDVDIRDGLMFGDKNVLELSNWDVRAIYADGF